MFTSPQTRTNVWILLCVFNRVRIIYKEELQQFFCFSPCHMSSPVQFCSFPKVHVCSQPACPELSPNEVASQSE